jgi:arsenate reductase
MSKGRPDKEKILFICHHNSGRSQLAEALLRMLYGDRFEAYSAGVIPTEVNPYAIKVMEQLGVDMTEHRSKSIDEFKNDEFDYVITVCDKAKETCPYFPGRKILHHSFSRALSEGSEEEILRSFIIVRDEIRTWLEEQFIFFPNVFETNFFHDLID